MKTIFFLPTEQFARFERLATMLAESTFGVPEAYRGDVGSCLNAVDIAHRLNVSPLVVLQNVRDVGGRPSFTYQFAKALIEDSGIITGTLQYQVEGELQYDGTSAEGKPYRVRAFGASPTGATLEGPWITWRMAELERWTENPQYISMPEVMFRARATTFFYNQFASSLMMGFQIEGDPAIGNAKIKPTPAVESLSLPVVTTATNDNSQLFAKALDAAPKADPTVFGAASAPASSVTTELQNGNGQGELTPPASQPPADAPKPRGRKPKNAESASGTPAPQANTTATEQSSTPPLLLEQESPPAAPSQVAPVQQASPEANIEQPGSAPQGNDTDKTQTAATVAETSAHTPSSMDRFSDAFAKVDATIATGVSLKDAMDLIQTFDAQEAEDLYLVLLGNAEKHLTSFVGRGNGLTAEEVEFAGTVRELHAKTKDVASSNIDVAERRKALHNAYTGLLTHLTRVKQGAAA